MKKSLLFSILFIVSLSYAQIVVNTELDTINGDDGLTSLREAVIEANETAGQQTISFNETVFLPGANRIIYLKSALELTDGSGVIINGDAGKVTLDGSVIDSTADNFKNGFFIISGNNEISNLYMQNFLGAAILIDSLSIGNNTIGPDNWISNNGGAGIMIISSGNNTIIGNNILNCGSDSLEIAGHVINNQDGIMLLLNANQNVIHENNVWSNYGCGIGVYRCSENTLLNNFIAMNLLDGIRFMEDNGGNVIEGNQLINNEESGIYMYMGSGNSIINNSIGQSGISKMSSFTNIHSDLTAKFVNKQVNGGWITDYGMRLYGIKETEIISNTISGCNFYGIELAGMMHIDSSGVEIDTTYHFPEGILIESNILENILGSAIHAVNTLDISVRENFVQLSRAGFQGYGLSKWDPEVVGRDSVERGDFIIENNIFSNIMGGIKENAILQKANAEIGGAISISSVQTASVINNEIVFSSSGIYCSFTTKLAAHSNTFNTMSNRGIDIYMVDSSFVENNHLQNIGSFGIEVSNPSAPLTGPLSSFAFIQDNVFSNITQRAVTCTTVTSLEVLRNIITNTSMEGIYIDNCNNSNVEGNEISGSAFTSLDARNSDFVNLVNNHITNPAGIRSTSIMLNTNRKSIMTGNVIIGASGYGISGGEADTVVLIDNEILSSQRTACNFGAGGLFQLMNNDIHGNYSGVYVANFDSVIIEENTISHNSLNGLSMYNVGNSLILDNFILENGSAGIDINNSDTCLVQNNYIADNGYGYITATASGQVLRFNTIQGNTVFGAFNSNVEDSLDARENYWGHANGPATSDTLYPGMEFGDRINEYVMYLPFLTDPPVELLLPPVITYIQPAESEPEGGSSATIHGRQFMPGIQVMFGNDTVQEVQYLSSTILKLTIPPGEGGYVDVIVINPDQLADTLRNGFYYIQYSGTQDDSKTNIPKQYALHPNYPNPFNPITTIRYDIVHKTHVELSIYNTMGQKIATLVNKHHNPGSYSIDWNADSYASGMYFYILRSKYFTQVKKLILLK